jgi:hypothetical protein
VTRQGVVLNASPPFYLEITMYQYEAVVRVGTQMLKTRIYAANTFDAKNLLQRQYGSHNLVGFVYQVH